MPAEKRQVWLQITSGRGPEECCRAIYLALQTLLQEAKEREIAVEILETIEGEYPKTVKSALLSLTGERERIKKFAALWSGTIQWIAASPFRPHHKRKNWFIAASIIEHPEKEWEYNGKKDFIIETMRAAGSGGQHINTTNSAVRITHKPTGLTASAQEERSQYLNKRLAFARVMQRIEERQSNKRKEELHSRWDGHNSLERGNPVRVFCGEKFSFV